MTKAKYDTIGHNYNQTRKADPFLVSRMAELLNVRRDRVYLDVGCGTGNYTSRVFEKVTEVHGVEPSGVMLSVAKSQHPQISFHKGSAENLPYSPESFDGILASLTLHHWNDLNLGLNECARVLKPGGTMVIFTSLPEQTKGYWLTHFFPVAIERSAACLPSFASIEKAMVSARMVLTNKEPYSVRPDLKDLFLYSGKHRPSRYLDPDFRKGISTFSTLVEDEELEDGLGQLKEKIDSGEIDQIIEKHSHSSGDYIFLVYQKRKEDEPS